MRLRIVALAAAAALTLSACSSTIAGSAQAGDPLPAPLSQESPDGTDGGDLSLPDDEAAVPDLGELLGNLGDLGGDGANLSDILDDLADSLGVGESGDSGADGGESGDPAAPGVPGLADLLGDSECLAVVGALSSVSMLIVQPMFGGTITKADVESAFSGLESPPAEIAADVEVLHQIALQAVDAGPEAAMALLDTPEFTSAMDHISTYMSEACAGS